VRISGIGAWPGGTVLDLAVAPQSGTDRDIVLAATFVGIYRSSDGGRRWNLVDADLHDWFIQAAVLAPMEDRLVGLAASRMGWVYRSIDGGETWETLSDWRDMGIITRLVASPEFATDGIVFACTEQDGILKSSDRGRTWKAASFGLLNLSVVSLCFSPDFGRDEVVFAGTDSGGLFRSRNGGRAWRESGEGLPNSAVQCVALSPNYAEDGVLFAGTEDRGLYRSQDGGRTWAPVVDPDQGAAGALPAEACVNSLYVAPDWAAGGPVIAATDEGILVSSDGGASWAAATGPDYPYVLASTSSALLVGAYDEGVYRSARGDVWQASNEQMAAHLPPMVVFSDRFAEDRSLLMASMEGTIVRSIDGAMTWQVVPSEYEASPGEAWGTVSLLAGGGEGTSMTLLTAAETELALSHDAGTSWTMLTGVVQESISALALSASFEQDRAMLVGTAGGQVLVSCDEGVSWEERALFEGETVVALAALAQDLYAVTAREVETGKWLLTLRRDAGTDEPWTEILAREAGQPAAVLHLSAGQSVYCATEQRVLCVSGMDLVAEGELADAEQISSLAALPDVVLAGSRTGLYRSADGARSWECVSSEIAVVALHAVSSGKVYAVSMGGQVWEVAAN
jgi:photosystem II stability/assembly factor-like uncharacterized protein